MLQSLVTFATLLATGAHGLFGCCWHHKHAYQHAGCQVEQSSEEKAVSHHQCTCRNAQPHDDDEKRNHTPHVVFSESAPCGHSEEHGSGECCEAHCQFLTNAKVELPSLDGPNVDSGLVPWNWDSASYAASHWGLQTRILAASLLTGSLSVRDLTQIARI